MRFRHLFLAGGSALVLGALYLTDPDQGITTAMLILSLVAGLLAVAFTHPARKALHDYPEADMRRLFAKAGEHPIGAGLAIVGLSIVTSALIGLFGSIVRAEELRPVPARAVPLLPVLAAEVDTHWPDMPWRPYLGGLIEHESCLTLTHSRCWSPTARLKSAREEGAGLGQLTRAWHPDGRLRFDALQELRERHPALRELDWATVYERPDLQLRAVVLKVRQDYRALEVVRSIVNRLDFADAAYNGGLGGVQRERRACGLQEGCDPQVWFGHVEHVCLKSRRALYGGRSACDINRHHVADVVRVRAPRYVGWL